MRSTDANGEQIIEGSISSMEIAPIKCALYEIENRKNDKSPSHRIIAKAAHGGYVEVGSAFEFEIKRDFGAVVHGYNMVFSDPYFKEVKFSLFPTDRDGEYTCKLDTFKPKQQDNATQSNMDQAA